MKHLSYEPDQLTEFLAHALEAALAEEGVYGRSVIDAVDYELHEEWKKYLEQTKDYDDFMLGVFLD